MKKPLLKKILKLAGYGLLVVIVLLAVAPFLVPIKPLDGLATVEQVARSDSRFVTLPWQGTDGLDIHYLADDLADEDGPTFVLLHGSMLNAYSWSEVLDYFDQRGNVVAYDQIPYGLSEKLVQSDWSGPNPYTAPAAVDQLVAFLDQLDLDQVVLVGSSYGGKLAVQAALAHPERVLGLVLVDAAVYAEEEMPGWMMNIPQVRHLGPLLARMLGNNEPFVRQMYADPTRLDGERLAMTMLHTEVQDWDMAVWQYLRAWGIDAPDLAGRMAEIEVPALVISGDSDAIVPVADSRRLAAELPNAELAVINACGHLPQEECPQAFEASVDAWLTKQAWR